MKKIFKYEIQAEDIQKMNIPSERILSVQEQRNKIVVYALVDTENTVLNAYEFGMNGTGNPVTFDIDNFEFLGTVKLSDGQLMFHVFYRKVEK